MIFESNTNFGDTITACVEDPFHRTFIYNCAGPGDEGWVEDEGGCVFVPRAQVTNNWGWCNYDATGAHGLPARCYSDATGGCYGGDDPNAPVPLGELFRKRCCVGIL